MRFSVASLITVLAATSSSFALLRPTTTSVRQLNPDPSVLQNLNNGTNLRARAPRPAPAPVPIHMSNAKRLSLGLPLNPPVRRSLNKKAHLAKRSSVPPLVVGGYILVTNLDTATVLGYISPTFNDFKEYGNLVATTSSALKVSLSYDALSPSQIEITAMNGADSFAPLFGGIVGYASSSDDLGPGNPNYQYIGGVTHTPVGAPPTDSANSFEDATQIDENVESCIWNYDIVTGALTPQWVNSDGATPANSLMYVSDEPLFAITGDAAEFKIFYGLGASVTFTFVPSA